MTNTIEALKKLYVAMGGNEADVADLTITPEMISAIADIYQGGGGSGLPEVTSEDNGDILKVVEGAWAKGAAPTELPAVTGTDNGKLLGVSEGAWSKVDAPSGAVSITLSADSQTAIMNVLASFITAAVANSGALTYYKTTHELAEMSEIRTALNAGKPVYLVMSAGTLLVTSFDAVSFSCSPVFTEYNTGAATVNAAMWITATGETLRALGFATVYTA